MLASIWLAPDAISVWTEVIAERKRMLSSLGENDPLNMSSLAASQVMISREQIASWDSSIRSWLLTADEAYRFFHTQLRLIIGNVGVGVKAIASVYPSVVEAWRNAMTTVERVLCGEGQSIRTGSPVLGLLSWHVYPDMLVLGEVTKNIQFHDPLVPSGGLVTLGLYGRESLDSGVYWSLPLSHLKYYGHPIKSTGNVNSQTSRVTMEQLLQIALGCLLRGWSEKKSDLLQAAEVLSLIADLLCEWSPNATGFLDADWSNSWLATFGATAQKLQNADPQQNSECMKLVRTGQRRYQTFLSGEEEAIPPVLGLCSPETFLEILREPEARTRMLREFAERSRTLEPR